MSFPMESMNAFAMLPHFHWSMGSHPWYRERGPSGSSEVLSRRLEFDFQGAEAVGWQFKNGEWASEGGSFPRTNSGGSALAERRWIVADLGLYVQYMHFLERSHGTVCSAHVSSRLQYLDLFSNLLATSVIFGLCFVFEQYA